MGPQFPVFMSNGPSFTGEATDRFWREGDPREAKKAGGRAGFCDWGAEDV